MTVRETVQRGYVYDTASQNHRPPAADARREASCTSPSGSSLSGSNLDPLVARWRRDRIPFICRTWYCGPGMPQYGKGQCPGNVTNTRFGETGCYIEAPHGIIVEALCPLGQGLNKTLSECLTSEMPGTFDLCSAS